LRELSQLNTSRHGGLFVFCAATCRSHQSEVPYTPKEAAEYWANYEKEHPEYIVTQRTNFAQQYADRVETQAEQASKCEFSSL
jgi:hypothetical protein